MATDFHDASKPWARIKHGLLGGYLSLFLGKLGSIASKIFYIDGFAGSGRLGDGSEGSAVYAARLAIHPPQMTVRNKLHCINVEKEVFSELEAATEQFRTSGQISNLKGEFGDLLPFILKQTEGYPALFFIDPFGTDGAVSSTIEQIAGRSGPTEVLIRYDDTRVKRLIMWAHSNRESLEPNQRKTAEAFQERYCNLTDEEAARAVIEKLGDGDREGSRELLIESYMRLITERTSFQFALCYPIRNPNTKGHKYFLVHFSQHPDGYIYMADHMAQAERAYNRLSADIFSSADHANEPVFPSILAQADDAVNQKNVSELVTLLPALIEKSLNNGVSTQNRHVYRHIVDSFRWTYLRKEYCAALRKLRDNGMVSFEDSADNTRFTRLK